MTICIAYVCVRVIQLCDCMSISHDNAIYRTQVAAARSKYLRHQQPLTYLQPRGPGRWRRALQNVHSDTVWSFLV